MDQIKKNFLEFEKEKRLFERKYCGTYYWQTIRFSIGRLITMTPQGNTNSVSCSVNTNNPGGKRYLALGKDFLKELSNYCHLKKCDILYFDKGMKMAYRDVDGKKEDVYFGYFEYEKKYQVQRCYYVKKNEKNPQKPGIGTDLILPDKLILKVQFLLRKQKYIDQTEEAFIRSLCDEMNVRYNKNISPDKLIKEIRELCITHKTYEKFYSKILKKTTPRVIVVTCHYGPILFPLYNIAKEFSIPVIELQHGLTCSHLAYNYGDVSEKGKELPDYLFTYGAFWEEYMKLPENLKTVQVGNPFLEAMKEKYKHTVLNEKAIVFYSSSFFYDGEELEKLAVDFCKKYSDKGYEIYFKFHPGEMAVWKERYRLLHNCKEIQIIDPSMNIYEIFAFAKHHVFVASTVMYEAMNYDICRYVYTFESDLKSSMLEKQMPLMEKGGGVEFHDAEELEDLINKGVKAEAALTDDIWKPNARENGQKALEKILSMSRAKNGRV